MASLPLIKPDVRISRLSDWFPPQHPRKRSDQQVRGVSFVCLALFTDPLMKIQYSITLVNGRVADHPDAIREASLQRVGRYASREVMSKMDDVLSLEPKTVAPSVAPLPSTAPVN